MMCPAKIFAKNVIVIDWFTQSKDRIQGTYQDSFGIAIAGCINFLTETFFRKKKN